MKRKYPDLPLFFITLILMGIGIVVTFSASAILAYERYGDTYYFFKRQVLWSTLGFLVMMAMVNINYETLRGKVRPLFFLVFLFLLLVFVPHIGKEVGGARRWIRVGSFTFQPAELAKLALILYISDLLAKKKDKIDDFLKGTLPPLLIFGGVFGLIILQPDLGTAVAIGLVVLGLFFVAGIKISHILMLGLLSLPLLYTLSFNVEYRRKRILAFLNPWSDPQNSGFQIVQSLVALGSGGLWGVGLGAGRQKLFYLPAPHTDFIFSIIGEELGLIGTLGVIALFLGIIWRGTKISLCAPDTFGSLLAMGITGMIGMQAIINMGVATGLLPTKGLPLPLVSFGGSSLIFSMAGIGILLNISRQSERISSRRLFSKKAILLK